MNTAPNFAEDLFADSVIENPWPVYARMRNLGPVLRISQLDNFALPRHAEVQQVLRDHEMFISGQGVAADQFGCDFLQGNTVASDGERHTLLRSAMAQPILPGALGSIRAKVQEAADIIIEQLVEKQSFDAVEDLARFLPFSIVRDLIGLPEFGQVKMLQWAAAAFDVLGVQNQRGKDALPVIGEMRQFIERDATRDKLAAGSWTQRIHDLVDEGLMPAECAAYAIRDYINPSLDTTISATTEMIKQLANNPEQWEILKQQPELINNAINEAVRLGTPIRTFSRHAASDTVLADVPIAAGSRVMLLFASANRDERKFPDADQFDVHRAGKDHVGFGSGIHMCVGMHLAQLEMQALLKAMIPRVAKIDIGQPTVKFNNIICAYEKLPCHFTAESRSVSLSGISVESHIDHRLRARVTDRRTIAKDIDSFVLSPIDSNSFPTAQAGAHIDLHLPTGLVRQYSLTEAINEKHYNIAVLKTTNSRGGSDWIHENLTVGSEISISKPRNHFPLTSASVPIILIAGGIGMTPLLAMAWTLHHRKCDFAMHMYVRNPERLPYRHEQHCWPFADKLHCYTDEQENSDIGQNIAALLSVHRANVQLYVCGPSGFMDCVIEEAIASGLDKTSIHLEHFKAEANAAGEPFTLIASQSELTLEVPEERTALQVLTEAGISVDTSCEHGVCGSCLTDVLQGIPDHRDSVQTEAEKLTNRQFAVCCSRSKTKTIVLDI